MIATIRKARGDGRPIGRPNARFAAPVGGPRIAAAVAAAVFVLCAAAPTGSAASTDPGFACGSPLGPEADHRTNVILDETDDPEFDLIDAMRMPGAQRSAQIILSVWGKLVLVGEAKVDQGTNFSWAIFARVHSNTTGWNTTAIWLSSPDTSQYYPQGAHIRPSAVVWEDRVWVAWDAQGSAFGGPTDRLILLRSIDRNGSADATRVASATDPSKTTQHPVIVAGPAGLELAYSTADGDVAPGDTHLVARSFDGAVFGPTALISNISDGWADALPALAGDGAGGLFAAWTAANATGLSSLVMFASRGAGGWSAPQALAQLGNSPSSPPAVAFFASRAYIAYSTDYFPDLNGTDSEVRWLVFAPSSGAWVGPTTVNPEPSSGDDAAPTLTVAGGRLLAGWSTTEDFYYSHGSDSDPVFRPFDGSSFGDIAELSAADDRAADHSPYFVEVGNHLYAHWMQTPPQQPGDPRGNSREAIRLISRPPQWYDGLSVEYRVAAVSENGSTLIGLTMRRGGVGEPAGSIPLSARLADGSLIAFEATRDGRAEAWLAVDPLRPDFEVLACGKPLPLARAPDPPPIGPGPPLVQAALILTAVFVAAAAIPVWTRRKGPRGPP